MSNDERVWVLEVMSSLLTGSQSSPTFRIHGTYEEAREVQDFLARLMVETVLTPDGLEAYFGLNG